MKFCSTISHDKTSLLVSMATIGALHFTRLLCKQIPSHFKLAPHRCCVTPDIKEIVIRLEKQGIIYITQHY